jgi:hypothetical protein
LRGGDDAEDLRNKSGAFLFFKFCADVFVALAMAAILFRILERVALISAALPKARCSNRSCAGLITRVR